jgi:hypothetical protein
MECSVFNWRILLGGAASAAILTAGVAAPAFAVPHAGTPIPLTGVTQGLNGAGAGGVFCALPNLPVSVGLTAAAGAIGESCSSNQVDGNTRTFATGPQQASDPQGSQAQGDESQASGQANGPARITGAASAPSASGASSAMPGLNSLSGVIPNLGNAASVVPDLGNVSGSLTGPNGSASGAVGNLVPSGDGSNPVTGAISGVAGTLSGASQNGGPATGPLP